MTKHKTKTNLLKALNFWTKERAQAIKDGDKTAQAIADRNRENTLKALEKIIK